MTAPVITFLSDYGLDDDFVGVCHGVMARICPTARIIDLTHGVPRHDARAGALVLAEALPYLPVGVHLAVVDPDVGAERRAVAVQLADGRRLVGPDNGLLWLAAQTGGGIVDVADIAHSPCRLEPVSATFHGRDIFAPVAAHLASGAPLGAVGIPCDPDALVRLELPPARREGDGVLAHARYIDRFGNVGLGVDHRLLTEIGFKLGQRLRLTAGHGEHEAQYARTFADVPPDGLLVYEDSYRRLAVAVRHGSAAQRLGVGLDEPVRIDAA